MGFNPDNSTETNTLDNLSASNLKGLHPIKLTYFLIAQQDLFNIHETIPSRVFIALAESLMQRVLTTKQGPYLPSNVLTAKQGPYCQARSLLPSRVLTAKQGPYWGNPGPAYLVIAYLRTSSADQFILKNVFLYRISVTWIGQSFISGLCT